MPDASEVLYGVALRVQELTIWRIAEAAREAQLWTFAEELTRMANKIADEIARG